MINYLISIFNKAQKKPSPFIGFFEEQKEIVANLEKVQKEVELKVLFLNKYSQKAEIKEWYEVFKALRASVIVAEKTLSYLGSSYKVPESHVSPFKLLKDKLNEMGQKQKSLEIKFLMISSK